MPFQHGGDRAFQHAGVIGEGLGCLDQEFVDEALGVVLQCGRHFGDHAEAEILQYRYCIRQRQRSTLTVDFQPRPTAVVGIKPHGAVVVIVEPRETQYVARRLFRRGAVAIARREGGGMTQRKTRGARRIDQFAQGRFDRRYPAPHHAGEPRVERSGVRHIAFAAQIERVTHHRHHAVFQRDRPVEQRAVARFPQHLANRDTACGGQIVARQPDEGEHVPSEHGAHQYQLGPRTIRQRHRGQCEVFQARRIERGDQIVRQGGQRMGQRLAGVTLGVEAEFRLQRGEAGAQHGNLLRRCAECGAGPQSGVDRQADDLLALDHRHQSKIERDVAVHARDTVRLQQQRRFPTLLEPFERKRARGFGKDRYVLNIARQAKRSLASGADPHFVAEQGEIAVEEPAQQCRPFLAAGCTR